MTRTLNLAERRIGWHRLMRSRWAAHVGELGVILAAAAATTFLAHALIAARFDATTPQAKALGPLWAAAMIALAIAGHLVRRLELSPARERLAVSSIAGVAVGLVMTPLMAGLHGTPQPLNTILGGDQQFHTEYVTRFASTWHLQDYTFRHLHAFYPPAWFWLAGRTADLFGVTPPWHIVKPFTIGTIGAALLFSYVLWSMVISRAGALSAAIGSSLVLTSQTGPLEFATQSWYSPHSCFVAVVGVAWLAATLCAVRRDRADAGKLVLLALVGALLALSYYLLFLLLLAVLAVLIVATRAGRGPAIRRLALLCGGMAVLTAVFWAPALGTALRGNPSQGHFVRPDFLHVSVGFDGPTGLALLAGVAVVLLALTFTRPASQAVGALLVGTVVYQLASLTTLLIAQNQLQPHRAVTMMWATFGAAVPVAIEGMRRPDTLVGALPPPVVRVLQVAALSLAIPAVFLLGSDLGSDLAAGPYTQAAHHPPGLLPAKEVTSFVAQTTGKRPQDLTLLTNYRAPLVTEPYYGFLPLRARYANPDAKLSERVAVLRSAAACPDAACTTRELTQSKFGPIDAMVLTLAPGGYRVDTQIDAYPHPKDVSVTFPRRNIDPAVWSRRNVAHYAVFARRPG